MLIVTSNKFWVLTVVCHIQKDGKVVVHEYKDSTQRSSSDVIKFGHKDVFESLEAVINFYMKVYESITLCRL